MADFKQITVGGVSHPVKDEVARQGLVGKQDKLTFDDTPTANSNNPVKSGGVYQAIREIDVSSQISGKADKSEMSVVAGTGADADKTTITLKNGTSATVLTQHQDISGKQDTIQDLSTIRRGAAAGATAYQKPGTGIPSTDLASAAQTSLERADEAAVRPYNTQSPDGMGYLVLDKDATFASQVTSANTIYEIRYDYDLNGQTITLPAGCVLKFDGGSLRNGTIVGQNTCISGNSNVLFNNISFDGEFCGNIDINWFPIVYNEQVDNAKVLDCALLLASLSDKKVLKLNENSVIWVQSVLPNPNLDPRGHHYYVDGSVKVRSGVTFDMNNSTIKCIPNASTAYNILYANEAENIKICNGTICGDLNEHTGSTGEWGYGIAIFAVHNFTIENVICENTWGDGICLDVPSLGSSDETEEHLESRHPMNGLIKNCVCRNNRRQGLSLCAGLDIVIENSIFCNTSGTNPQSGIDIEPGHYSNKTKNIQIRNCEFHHNSGPGLILWNAAATGIDNCIENVTIDNCYSHDNSNYDYSLCGNKVRLCNDKKSHSSIRVKGYTNYGIIIDNCTSESIVFDIGYETLCSISNCDFYVDNGACPGLVYIVSDSTHKREIAFKGCNFSVYNTATLPNSTIIYMPTVKNDSNIIFDNCVFESGRFNILSIKKPTKFTNCFWKLLSYLVVGVFQDDSIVFTGNTIESTSTNPLFQFRLTSDCNASINLTGTKVIQYRCNKIFGQGEAILTLDAILNGMLIESIESALQVRDNNVNINVTGGMICGYYPTLGKTVYYKAGHSNIFLDEKGFTPNISSGTFAQAQSLATNDLIKSTDKGYEFYATDKSKPIYYGGDGKWYDATGAEVTA